MSCSQVTQLLSEYVDDVLDPPTRRLVEEHLAECRNCAAELASLRTYLEAMRSLPPVPAPADFLAGVHARLEQPGWFKRLLTWLFFPVTAKLPFELAGLVAASVLVVLIYRGAEPEKVQFSPATQAPSLQAPAAPAMPMSPVPAPAPSVASPPTAEKSREISYPSAVSQPSVAEPLGASGAPVASRFEAKEGGAASGPTAASRFDGQAQQEELAAPPRPRSSFPAASAVPREKSIKSPSSPAVTREAARPLTREPQPGKPPTAPSAAVPTPVELVLHLAPSADREAVSKDVRRDQAPAGAPPATTVDRAQERVLARKAAPAPMQAAEATDKGTSTASLSPATTLSRIKELAEQAKGSILSVDYEPYTLSPQALITQIPARQYPTFLSELRRLGRLEEPDVQAAVTSQDALLQLRIRLSPTR